MHKILMHSNKNIICLGKLKPSTVIPNYIFFYLKYKAITHAWETSFTKKMPSEESKWHAASMY